MRDKVLNFQRQPRVVDFSDSAQQWMISWSKYLMNRYTMCSTPLAAMTSATAYRDTESRRHVRLG